MDKETNPSFAACKNFTIHPFTFLLFTGIYSRKTAYPGSQPVIYKPLTPELPSLHRFNRPIRIADKTPIKS
jgi:hypothetical protein